MKPNCKKFIQYLVLTALALTAISCNDLSVFVPPNTRSNVGEVSTISIDENGKLALEWTRKGNGVGSTYEAYLAELLPDDSTYAFTGSMETVPPLMVEHITVPYASSPYKIGTLVATAKELTATLTDTLKPDRKYLLQLVEKKKVGRADPKVLLLQVAFETNVPTSAAISEDGSTKISWASVAGANSYEVYADKNLTILLGESDINELIIAKSSSQSFQEFYVRPMRGDLASKEILHIELDQSAVKAIKVSAIEPDGVYTTGQRLEFVVDFSDSVTVFGDTFLPIRTNAGIRKAEYLSGSGTRSLHFVHTIAAGDDTLKLDTDAVLGGSLSDKSGLSVAGALPLAGSGATLKDLHAIAIDTIAPTAPFSVGFNNTLVSTGNFNLSWGAGTDLYFQDHLVKLCSDSACSTACNTSVAEPGISKSFSGISEGTYYGCVQSRDTTGLLSAWVPTLTPVTIDATGPSIVRVYAPNGNANFKEGQTLQIAIEFNEIVQAFGTSDLRLKLETGLIDRTATYVSGTGTRTLVFSYAVQTGDESQDLNYLDASSLELGATGSIRDLLNNPATLTLPSTNAILSLAGQNQLVIDTTSPGSVASVDFASPVSTSTSLSFTFGASADLNFKQFNVKLCTASDCSSSCGPATPRSTSPATLVGTDGGSFFACVQGEDLVGHLSPWVASSSAVLIDSTAPTIAQVASTTANGVYKATQNIDITVEFSEAVTVTNSAGLRLLLETGSVDREAVYTSGSGSAVLTFTYSVQAGDISNDLNYQSTAALILGGATIQDAVGLNASMTLPAPGSAQSLASNRAIRIDTQVPSNPSAVAFDSSLSNTTNLSLSWTPSTDAHFDHHNVKICADNLCSTDCVSPTTTAGSSATLTGVDGDVYYACVQGEDSLGHVSAWIASSSTAAIDMTAPIVVDLNSTLADGLHTSGTVVDIQVKFSKIVNITVPGDLSLMLNTSPVQYASYQSGSGTDTLTFRYTVSAGDTASDLGYSDQSSLVIGSGTIRDLAGNQAALGLPALVSASSLQGQKAIVIDTTVPVSPNSVGFSSSLVNTTSFPMSWNDSTDDHFQTHNVKLCASSDCVTSCTSELTSTSSPATMVGISGSTYYG